MYHPTRVRLFVFITIIVLLFAATAFFIIRTPKDTASELAYLRSANSSQKDVEHFFEVVAKEKGGVYAYDLLRQAPFLNVDTHEVGHVIGDVLYKQKGIQGIHYCTHEFRNACSHSIVIHFFIEHGEAGVSQAIAACQNIPGFGNYLQCFHALGHGMLASQGYDLPKTAAFCTTVGTPEFDYKETKECIGGTIMELIGGGAHDPDLWKKKRAQYVTVTDPLRPCSDDFIPAIAKKRCYVYLTPHLFWSAGLRAFDPAINFSTAFSFCSKLSTTDLASRSGCYGGFGKEFLSFIQQGDVRKSGHESDADLAQLHTWCGQAGTIEGTTSCVINTLESLYWDGKNSHLTAINFCELSAHPVTRSACFLNIIALTFTYVTDRAQLERVCADIPDDFKKECNSHFIPIPLSKESEPVSKKTL